MILGIDTDVLVHWAMDEAPHHVAVRRLLGVEIERQQRLGLTQQALYEFLHIVTDGRRFANPMEMPRVIGLTRQLWNGSEVEQIIPWAGIHNRVCELMERWHLGRKRILDTALAATLESTRVRRLCTLYLERT